MNEMKELQQLVNAYTHAVHTQDREEFCSIWSTQKECSLISITKVFKGIESIFNDFLIGIIRELYTVIDLIADDVDIRLIDEDHALIIFQYHTECKLRETGEDFGIAGLETQLAVKENGTWKLLHVHYSKD